MWNVCLSVVCGPSAFLHVAWEAQGLNVADVVGAALGKGDDVVRRKTSFPAAA